MNELQLFENKDFGTIRVLTIDGEPWFVGEDVVLVLGYKNPQEAIRNHVDEEDTGVSEILTPDGRQKVQVINYSGLYSLVLSSELHTARSFKHWITSEVLPSIQHTGGYVSNEQFFINTYLPFADSNTKALFTSTLTTLREANAKITTDKPKVLFADAVSASKSSILIGDLAKLIRQNGVDIGQNRLFIWLRDNKYLCATGERYNMPTQRSMELGLFEIKETTVSNPDGNIRVTKTTKVTGKGQQYFINRFLRRKA